MHKTKPKSSNTTFTIKNIIKSCDIYSKPIQLTYQGQRTLKTSFGGIISILLILALTGVFFSKLKVMVKRENTTTK